MNLIIDVGGKDSNSYVTLEEAQEYVNIYGSSKELREGWSALEELDQTRLLIQAVDQNDSNFHWVGMKVELDQALAWPRIISGIEYGIPKAVKQAQCEQALWLMNAEPPQDADSPLSAIAVGPIKVNFNEKSSFRQTLYMADKVKRLLSNLGTLETPESTNTIRTIRLVRA